MENQLNTITNPADQKKIRDAFHEISASMSRVEGEKTFQKEALNTLAEQFQIPKKILSRAARTFHKMNIEEVKGEDEDFVTFYETVIEPPQEDDTY